MSCSENSRSARAIAARSARLLQQPVCGEGADRRLDAGLRVFARHVVQLRHLAPDVVNRCPVREPTPDQAGGLVQLEILLRIEIHEDDEQLTATLTGPDLGLVIGTDVQAHDADLDVIAGLVDPNADRILFWDDSAGAYAYLTAGSGLTISGTTLSAGGGGNAAFQWTLDEGGVPATNYKGWIVVPFNCTIIENYVLADQTGDIVIDVWKDSYANFPPTVADSITASAKPTLTSAVKYHDTTLTGWTTSLTAGDVLTIKVDSAATLTLVTFVLIVSR